MSADRQVLSFAAVRLHGRAFLLMLTVAPGLPSELAIRIADVVKPAAEVTVTVTTPDSNEGERAAVRAELVRALQERGIRPVDAADGRTSVSVNCGSNLRESICIAEIVRPDADAVLAVVARPLAAGVVDRARGLSLET